MVTELVHTPKLKNEEDMRQFMEDIRCIPLLTAQEEKDLARRSAQGDEDAIRQLVNANLRLVVAIARRYYNGAVPMLDMIQEGAIGLLAAARKFDYTKDVRFSTYAAKWIRQGIMRYVANNMEPIRVPAHTAALIHRVTESQAALRLETGLEPSLEAVARHCGLPEEKVRQLLQLQPKICSLDAAADPDGGTVPVADTQNPQPHQQLVREELVRTLEQLMDRLAPRQKQLLQLRFGMTDGKYHSLEDVGAALGISKERARQVEKQAMDKLKQLGADIGLEDFLE